MRRSRAIVMALGVLVGCNEPKRADKPAGDPVSPDVPLPTAASGSACRAMSVSGSVLTATGEPVAVGGRLAGDRWLVLAAGARLTIKHTDSGRELALEGPGRMLPCVDGEEELVVGEGVVGTQASAGVRPGATVLIGTPFGSLRYADARARVGVRKDGLFVDEVEGDVWLVPADAGEPRRLERAVGALERTEAASADAALAACSAAADDAHAKASALVAGGSDIGALAGAHVRARQRARFTCAAASAAALAQGRDAADIAARLLSLAALRDRWRRVPGGD